MGYSKGTSTRTSIVQGAAELVLARGFGGTLIDDVCKHLGITRGRLTHHFRTRDQLLDAVQSYAFDFFRSVVIAPLRDDTSPPVTRIRNSFAAMRRVYLEMSGDVRGCFIGHSAMESSGRSDEMRAKLRDILDEWRSGFASVLVDGGLSQQNAEGTALIALATIEGAILLARAAPDDAKLLATFDALEKMLRDAIKRRQRA